MIRQAKRIDIACIAKLIFDAWQQDLVNLVSAEASKSFSIGWFADRCLEDLSCEKRNPIVYLKNDEIVGYACGNTGVNGFDAELFGLYVSPSEHRTGVGKLLFDEIKRICQSEHKSNMVVWTLLDAPNNHFYLKHDPLEMLERDIHIHGSKYRGVGFVYAL